MVTRRPGPRVDAPSDEADVLVVNTWSSIIEKRVGVYHPGNTAEYKKIGRVQRDRGGLQRDIAGRYPPGNAGKAGCAAGRTELESIVALCEGMEPPAAAP